LLEIEKTFDFFKATTSDEHIDRIVICGGASRVGGFADLLFERLGAPVERLDPFKTVELDPARLGGAVPEDVASTAAVAVGLALRRAGDR
jgi:type IV pilus assembly protein PilM